MWKPVGLTPSQAYVLLLIFSYDAIQPSSIANALLLEPAAVTRLVKRLEKKGLVTRIFYSNIVLVDLTPKAYDLFDKLAECDRNFQNECSRILGGSEISSLVARMNHATDNIILKMNN